ncbi:aspartate--tRNA(Asn) ligase [Methanococcoides sp. SA1]|nr:aspartate--tRNA(Asn) ligase [Methanococcoides sp. SA1]
MERTKVRDLGEKVGESVKVVGFVHEIRDQSKIKFFLIRDVSGIVQCISFAKDGEVFEKLGELTRESVVEVEGELKASDQAPGGFEILIKGFDVLSKAEDLPIHVVEKGSDATSLPKRLDYRWLDLRKPENLKIFKLYTELEKGMRAYFDREDFIQIYTPSFMSAPSESGAEVFELDYFGKKAYLAQSPQFYKQMGLAAGFEKVFVMGPVFRAEKSDTTRHVTEFFGWDFEVAYVKEPEEVMDMEEDLLISAFEKAKESLPDLEIEVPSKPFPRISMKDAKAKLKEAGVSSKAEDDVSPEEERELCRIMKEETGHDFVFLTEFPISSRPFYHMRYEDRPELTKSFDLLYRGLEITTGAVREHRVEVLKKQAEEKGMPLDSLKKYLEFFSYGCPPHGGCGIGPSRIVMKMLDLENVKEAIFLPRDMERLDP